MGLREDVAAVLRRHRVGLIDECDQIASAVMVPVSAHVDAMAEVVEQQRQEIERLRRDLEAATEFQIDSVTVYPTSSGDEWRLRWPDPDWPGSVDRTPTLTEDHPHRDAALARARQIEEET